LVLYIEHEKIPLDNQVDGTARLAADFDLRRLDGALLARIFLGFGC
jgi:hypothetical protein